MIVTNKISPWLDSTCNNLYRRELVLAEENLGFPGFKPAPLYAWIHASGASDHFFKGLAKLAPLFPVVGYNNVVSSWVSPPPSGQGNVVMVVMGRDANNKVRLVGSNFLNLPREPARHLLSAPDFFTKYDTSSRYEQRNLVRDAIASGQATFDSDIVRELERYCEFFHAMPIYITLLEDGGNLFACGPAVVEGLAPADFAYEVFGEVAP